MAEVIYSVNEKRFKDFEVYISESEGLFDPLTPKPVNFYDWPEYNGSAPDLSNPKFESREINLKGFVVGEDWLQMKLNFDEIISEFQKPGTHRLLVEPFGMAPLIYEVYLEDGGSLEKRFKEGEMVGIFSLRLIEPNPIKKVFFTLEDTVTLSYSSPYESEVFWGDGTKVIFSGDVNEFKDYHSPSYQASGYSIVSQSSINSAYYQLNIIPDGVLGFEFSTQVTLLNPKELVFYVLGKKNGEWEVVTQTGIISGPEGLNKLKVTANLDISEFDKFIFKILDPLGNGITEQPTNPRIEYATISGEFINKIGKEKYIVIAGDINNLSNVTSTAIEVWTKL